MAYINGKKILQIIKTVASQNTNGFYQTSATLNSTVGNTTTVALTDIESYNYIVKVGDQIIDATNKILGVITAISGNNATVETTAILSGGGSTPTLLWQNATPNNSFSPTTIDIPTLSSFKYIVVKFKSYRTGIGGQLFMFELQKDTYGNLGSLLYLDDSRIGRPIGMNSGTQLYFGGGYLNGNLDNEFLIPLEIYGTNDL